MGNYLYGLSVQKIQSFIFETGKLKEIIGASDLVENICTSKFKEYIGPSYKESNSIVKAAGKIIYLFEEKNDCEKIVFQYIKSILDEVPGINIVQAVVAVNGDLNQGHFEQLEERLNIQKNKPTIGHGQGLMISERSRQTGGAGEAKEKGTENRLDRRQLAKLNAEAESRGKLLRLLVGSEMKVDEKQNALINNLLKDQETGWIAVVHADGNNLGLTIQKLSDKVTKSNPSKLQDMLRTFSANLDIATKDAAKAAFDSVIRPTISNNSNIPIRPVILGGDDLTVIIRGDLAIQFTEEYLKQFQLHTKSKFSQLAIEYNLEDEIGNGLTACAGISFIKSSYPLHYGVDLAESLCAYSKNTTKSLPEVKSCLTFHRVLSSFVEDYGTIIERELNCNKEVYFNFGPYFIERQSNYETISQLRNWSNTMNEEEAPKSSIRNWLTEMASNMENASQLMNRIKEINPKYDKKLNLEHAISKRGNRTLTHLFDAMTLANIEI